MRHRLQRSAIHDPKWEGDVEALARRQRCVPEREIDGYIGAFRIVQDHAGMVLYTKYFRYVYEDLPQSSIVKNSSGWTLRIDVLHLTCMMVS